jgi:hypothetical protein
MHIPGHTTVHYIPWTHAAAYIFCHCICPAYAWPLHSRSAAGPWRIHSWPMHTLYSWPQDVAIHTADSYSRIHSLSLHRPDPYTQPQRSRALARHSPDTRVDELLVRRTWILRRLERDDGAVNGYVLHRRPLQQCDQRHGCDGGIGVVRWWWSLK